MIIKRIIILLSLSLVSFFGFVPPMHAVVGVVGDAAETFSTPGHHPTGMCFDGRLIWLADARTYKIYGIDPGTGDVKKTLDTPGYDPRGLAWDGERLWCIDGGEGWIYGIDVKTGTAEKILESNSPDPGGLAFDGNFLWMIDRGAGEILKINRIDGMMHENIPAPSRDVNDLTFDGTYLWATDNVKDMLYRVVPASGDVITFLRSNGPYPYGICWDETRKTLWNADFQSEKLYRLDLESKEFKRIRNPRVYEWEVVQEFRNFGPDEVGDLEAFLAVPGNRDNQELLSDITYDPKPASFVEDRWGQRFARFLYPAIPEGAVQRSTLKVTARLSEVEYYVFPERVGRLKDIPKSLDNYLTDGFKYDIKNPVIQNAVKEAIGDETNPYWMMRKIFNYIIDKIDYKLKPLGGWNPAPTVLKRGTGSCSEYSFVFIAMCRAAGLPARYVGSVVVRSEDKGIDDVWHRWPEVYLPNYGWIPADPSAEGNRPTPGGKGRLIGTVGNRYLITTQNGGESEYLDFYYNFNVRWKTRGKCRISSKSYGEFKPVDSNR